MRSVRSAMRMARHPGRVIAGLVGRSYVPRLRAGRGTSDLGGGRYRVVPRGEIELIGTPHGWAEVSLAARADRPSSVALIYRWATASRELRDELGVLTPAPTTLTRYVNLTYASAVRLAVSGAASEIAIADIRMSARSPLHLVARAAALYFRGGRSGGRPIREVGAKLAALLRGGIRGGLRGAVLRQLRYRDGEYGAWRERHRLDDEGRRELRAALAARTTPLISVLMPVYDTPADLLERSIGSVRSQIDPRWELCIADDASTLPHVRTILERHVSEDPRIKVAWRARNGHISEASNSALALASGEFVALLDHDDELSEDALARCALEIAGSPETDVVYSDEDKVDAQGHHYDPYFKPDWSPEMLLAGMYMAHLAVYRRSVVSSVGGFRTGYEGSQDHDLALRVTERTQRVRHVSAIIYHWRAARGSTAAASGAKPYAYAAGRRALEDALWRRGLDGAVDPIAGSPGSFVVRPRLPDPIPLVTVLIPVRESPAVLEACLSSLLRRTSYPRWEIVLVHDAERRPEALALRERWGAGTAALRVVECARPSSFPAFVNAGAAAAGGDLLLSIAGGVTALLPDWVERMAAFAIQDGIGAVGCCLVDEGGSVRHAGMVLLGDDVAGYLDEGSPADSRGYFNRLLSHVNVSAVSGSCLMIRRSLFAEVGGLDEGLPCAFYDVDLCLRLAARGQRTVCLDHVRLVQSGDARVDPGIERETMRRRWGHVLARDPYYGPSLRRVPPDFSIDLA